MVALLSLLLAVSLSPPFGEASASATSLDDGLRAEVTVELDTSATVVLVRGRSALEELAPVALSEIAPGVWGGIVDLGVVIDLPVAFEAVFPDGTTRLSDVHRLSELGVDRAVFGGDPTTTTTLPGPAAPRGDIRWVWLAIAAGAAALALLVPWALWERRIDRAGDEPAEAESSPRGGTEPSASEESGGPAPR